MIYSRWDPSGGYYDYFEVEQRPGINDDLPVPQLPASTVLGVPSTECGRALPDGAVYQGSGELPVGMMAFPASVEQLGQSEPPMGSRNLLMMLGALAAGVGVGYVLAGWRPT